ncbi:Pol polyprotein [Elysia marginata]|uniref:Pol polyprotein n=1 Tax=Elysia marginata TaxID=1093978 RepID=A0AAV4G8M4_9GAST|nr:Pol polyprotein [Elysia marginata]
MQILVTNPNEESVTIPARTPIELIWEIIASPVTVQLARPEETPDFCRPHLPGDLQPEDQALLDDLLQMHSDVFAWKDNDLRATDHVHHKIVLHTDIPIVEPYRRIPLHHLQEVRSHIEDLVDRGIIETGTSPYAAHIVVVRKKSGDLRLCWKSANYPRLARNS